MQRWKMEQSFLVNLKFPRLGKKIKRVFLSPDDIEPLPETIDAIREADLIIIGPGSLYTSILPNLLVPKIGEEVCRAKAKKVYICNVMTQAGETLNYTASDHVKALYDHMKCTFMNTILVNEEEIPEQIRALYEEELAKPVHYDIDGLKALGLEVITDKIVCYENSVIRHDTKKVAKLLYGILQQDLS
jgi:uncharacterized cofD-like protein